MVADVTGTLRGGRGCILAPGRGFPFVIESISQISIYILRVLNRIVFIDFKTVVNGSTKILCCSLKLLCP